MKSEKRKMIDGELYMATDPELVFDRTNARRLTRMFNSTEIWSGIWSSCHNW